MAGYRKAGTRCVREESADPRRYAVRGGRAVAGAPGQGSRKDGVATAEYALALYERADAGEINPVAREFPR